MRKCREERSIIQQEIEYTYKTTGKHFWFDATYAFIPPDLVVLHTIDITERKETEIELERYRQGLEELVDERTHELREVNKRLLEEISERERTEKTLERRNRELAILNEAYKVIATSANVGEILDRILEPVMEFCGAGLGGSSASITETRR